MFLSKLSPISFSIHCWCLRDSIIIAMAAVFNPIILFIFILNICILIHCSSSLPPFLPYSLSFLPLYQHDTWIVILFNELKPITIIIYFDAQIDAVWPVRTLRCSLPFWQELNIFKKSVLSPGIVFGRRIQKPDLTLVQSLW